MPENFSIHDQNNIPENKIFQKDLNGPIRLDGTLSAVEINQCNQHFSENCKSIQDETVGKLGDFLRAEVIPNMENCGINKESQSKILALAEKYPEVSNTMTISPEDIEIAATFGISEEMVKILQESLDPYSMQFLDKLKSYKTYIEQELGLPSNSNLSSADHKMIIGNIAHSIGKNITAIPNIINIERTKYQNLSNHEIIGIINDELEGVFQDTKQILLPNTKLFLASTEPGFYENSEDIFYARGLRGNFREGELDIRTEIAQAGFTQEVNELGNLLLSGEIDDIPDIYNGWGNIGLEFDESIGLEDGKQEIADSSFLSPEDAERYKSAKIRASIFMIMQMIPGLDLIGMGIDIFDTFSNTDQSFEALKKLNIIDDDIHVGKAGWEQLLSGIGAIGGLISLDVATKGSRVMRVMSSAGITRGDLLGEVNNFASELGLPDNAANAVRRGISGFGANRLDGSFMDIARTNGRLSDIPGTENIDIGGNIISVSAREKAFLERLIGANQSGELPIPLDSFTPEQIQNLLAAINRMHEMHGSTRIGEHSFSQIKDKLAIAREHGIPLNISKIAIFEGFAGVSEMQNKIGFNAHAFKMLTRNNPALAQLLDNLHAGNSANIGDTLAEIDFDSSATTSSIDNLIGGWIEVDDFKKLTDFLESKGVEVSSDFIQNVQDNDGIPTDEESLSIIFNLLKSAQNSGNSEEATEVSNAIEVAEKNINASRNSGNLDSFATIREQNPQVVDFFEALMGDTEDISVALSRINYRNESVYDAIDFLITNSHGVISEVKLDEIARSVGKQRSDIIGDLEFIDGEAGITDEFLEGVFRFHEEATTGVPISTDPFEISTIQLSRLAKNTFGDIGENVSTYIRQNTNLQNAVKGLENGDYHNPDFLSQNISEIGDFYDNFGEAATRKLIAEVFGKGDTEFSKLFANITRYNEALKIAVMQENKRLIQVFEGLGIKNVSTFMTEGLSRVESFISSDWYNRTPESLAYFIGNELSPSRMYVELGKDNFLKLLQELNIDISSASQDEFFTTIEGLQTYKIAVSLNTAKTAK